MDDLAAPQHHRSGAHRARRHPLLVALLTLGAVAIASAVLLWGLLTFDVLGVGDDLRQAGGASSVAPPAATTQPSDEASAPASAVDPTGEPTGDPTGEPTQDPSEEPSEDAEPVVDRSLPVDVLNSTSTPGLAAGAGESLEDLGWTVGEVGNFDGDEIPTTVLYPEEDQQATAEAVAEDLGVGATELSQDVDVITLVLGPDYSG
ncbi:LytR C-terminal domain-containing protein [Jannaschia sp. R86511]|uniref:LytR C-terminal domain-containing protein n=1 Tax=Jannaschia sp. R86511 TaxID=3093853 RepID=UPI0036D28872